MLSILESPDLAQAVASWFWQALTPSGECLVWSRNCNMYGYGRFTTRAFDGHRHALGTHRVAYELTYGAIPAGLVVCHRCDNPPCCNPAHLFLGTIKDNLHDSVAKGRFTRGERQHNAKLTTERVQVMRQQYAAGIPVRDLASDYEVTITTVRMVVKRRIWRHVP
jgi:hypothetical protein